MTTTNQNLPITEIKEKVKSLKAENFSNHKISKLLNISKGKIRKILLDLPVELKRTADNFQKNKWQKIKQDEYERGFNSTVSLLDALCVGIYLGEGSWHIDTWEVSNSNINIIKQMVCWAIRAGQPSKNIKAHIQINVDVDATDESIKNHWSNCGIPFDQIRIYKITSKTSKKITEHRLPFGTCRLIPVKRGVHLFSYLQGQLAKLNTL